MGKEKKATIKHHTKKYQNNGENHIQTRELGSPGRLAGLWGFPARLCRLNCCPRSSAVVVMILERSAPPLVKLKH